MEIEQIASSYKPDEAGIEVVRNSRTVLLAGVTSSGKDTVQNRLQVLSDYHPIITHTTRPPRVNDDVLEQDGIAYHFVSREQMRQLLIDRKMIEINRFGENYYGTSVVEFSVANMHNKIALGDIDVNGVSAFYDIAPDNVTAIFIVPPDYQTWLQRVRKRYTSQELFDQDWQTRRDLAIAELEHALSVPHYHFVVNDNLDLAVELVDKIARYGNDIYIHNDDKAIVCARNFLDAIKRVV
jgi:guanylate kinase